MARSLRMSAGSISAHKAVDNEYATKPSAPSPTSPRRLPCHGPCFRTSSGTRMVEGGVAQRRGNRRRSGGFDAAPLPPRLNSSLPAERPSAPDALCPSIST